MLNNNKVYALRKHEFLLLAAVAGMQSIYGFDLRADLLKEETAIQILQQLSQKEYIRSVGDKFLLTEEISTIFEQIKFVETTMDIHKSSGRSCIIYLRDAAVKVAPSLRRKDVLEVMLLQKADIWTHLKDEGWISEDGMGIGEVL